MAANEPDEFITREAAERLIENLRRDMRGHSIAQMPRSIPPREAAEALVRDLCQSERHEESTLYRLIDFIYGKPE